jgi:hypothetical protein
MRGLNGQDFKKLDRIYMIFQDLQVFERIKNHVNPEKSCKSCLIFKKEIL